VLKEALRLYPPAWMLNSRTSPAWPQRSVRTLSAARTQVLISPWVVHRLENYFPHPTRFLPSRWKAGFEESLPRYAYMPFGGGPRICIGNSFALMEMHLLLTTLMQRFV
jgi:cytochrome P450